MRRRCPNVLSKPKGLRQKGPFSAGILSRHSQRAGPFPRAETPSNFGGPFVTASRGWLGLADNKLADHGPDCQKEKAGDELH